MRSLKRTLWLMGLCLGLGASVALVLGALPAEGAARGKRGAAKAGAAGKKQPSTRFYDFDDLLIDGEFRKPATLYTRALKSPKFDRLLRLQKSFLGQLLKTARYPSLRWFR